MLALRAAEMLLRFPENGFAIVCMRGWSPSTTECRAMTVSPWQAVTFSYSRICL